jgi:hypothetical protein
MNNNNIHGNKYLLNGEQQTINTNRLKNNMIKMNMNNYTKAKPKGGIYIILYKFLIYFILFYILLYYFLFFTYFIL